VDLTTLFCQLKPVKVLVLGDYMLDSYTEGKAERISPEAPVAVVHVSSERDLPGGAGNVVLGLLALGAEVTACGRVGADLKGERVLRLLSTGGADTTGMVLEEGFHTTFKNRVIASKQQVVRIDYEKVSEISPPAEDQLTRFLEKEIPKHQVLAISDYGKGGLSRTLLKKAIQCAKKHDIFVITDPKGLDFSKYDGTTLIKPNFSEAVAVSGLDKEAPLEEIGMAVLEAAGAEELLITRSEAGITYFDKKRNRHDFPAKVRQVRDVTGAGDTVLAALTLARGSGLSMAHACQIANVAAGLAVEEIGCAQVTLTQVARRLLTQATENKIFDDQHLSALKVGLEDTQLVYLAPDSFYTKELVEILSQLKSGGKELVLFISESEESASFAEFLADLKFVSALILSQSPFEKVAEVLEVQELYQVLAGRLQKLANPPLVKKESPSVLASL